MIIGERNRMGDLDVNITREKKLTNMRSSTADTTVTLRPPRRLSLDQCIEFIAEDELVEVTPRVVRLRKRVLPASRRERHPTRTGGSRDLAQRTRVLRVSRLGSRFPTARWFPRTR